jgi:hypothetical protein
MHDILAEDITGGLIAATAFLGALIASVLALCALVPAWKGDRRLTFALAAPAMIAGVLATLWIGYGFVTDGTRDPDDWKLLVGLLMLMAGPPLATSLLAIGVVEWSRRRKMRT